jgi:spermidine synthase
LTNSDTAAPLTVEGARAFDPAPSRRTGPRLATYSALILFFELALIRYTAGYVHVFSFYLNFVLIATFLGMGVGLLRAEHARLLKWIAVPAMALLFITIALFANVRIAVPSDPNEFLWSVINDTDKHAIPLPVVATSLFALCAIFFVPLGALLGGEFRKLPSLQAYSWDIGGGLAGICAFGILSATRQEPFVWFVLGLGLWLIVSIGDRRFAASLAVSGAVVLAVTTWTGNEKHAYWSPYYRINLTKFGSIYEVDVNGSMHQLILNLDSVAAATVPYARVARFGYLQPYRLIPRIDTALVVGAGTGNDISLLLMRGAKYIDAVEIDPVIAEIGKDVHPLQPYSDPRVHLHVNDARAFLRTTRQKYDVIVFGTLDSQTLLSGMSSVRLDNYVYTVESFKSARSRLTANGTMILYHMSAKPYIRAKIYQMLGEAFGSPPGVFASNELLFNLVFVAGKAASAVPAADPTVMAELRTPYPLAHDDWPYLYLRGRTLPGHYVGALLAVLLIAAAMMAIGGGEVMARGFDGAMFFMGAGFLLVETKSVTEMSLLFGSTWTVNLLVFASIMVMVLAANLWVMRNPVKRTMPLFGALFTTLLVAYLVPASSLLVLGIAGQWVLGGLMVALPVFFAALIFSTLLARRMDGARALAYNLLGAIIGGVLEYSSMVIGIKGLYLLAAALYVGALLLTYRNEVRTTA